MSNIDRRLPLIQLSDKVMNLAMKAYYISDNTKNVLKIRQMQDVFLDKLKEMSDPKAIHALDVEATRQFLNEKIKKGLTKKIVVTKK
jgi:hypothetical protein